MKETQLGGESALYMNHRIIILWRDDETSKPLDIWASLQSGDWRVWMDLESLPHLVIIWPGRGFTGSSSSRIWLAWCLLTEQWVHAGQSCQAYFQQHCECLDSFFWPSHYEFTTLAGDPVSIGVKHLDLLPAPTTHGSSSW